MTTTKLSKLLENEISDFQLLTETNLKRVLSAYMDIGFIIISANRSVEAELGKNPSPEDVEKLRKRNKLADAALKQDVRGAGYGYIPTWGGYKETTIDSETGEKKLVDSNEREPSYVITATKAGSAAPRSDFEKLKDLGIELCKKYDQDTFLYKPPNYADPDAYYLRKDGFVDMTFTGPVVPNDLMQFYYTQLRKREHERFSFTEVYIRKSPGGLSEAIKRYGEIFFTIT